MADRLTGMEVFVRAIRLGGLSAAARDMGISPTMAAKHLSGLESRLGVTLVNRTTRRLSLTEAGEAYLDHAERILGELGEAEAEVTARSLAVEGLLRVSAPAAFGVLHMAGLLAEFHHLHPNVTIELGLNDRLVDLLEERWDMAIRIGTLTDSNLIARKLADMHLNICASPAYLNARGVPKTVKELSRHDCLGYTLSPLVGTSQWSFGRDGSIKVPVAGSLHANNGDALVKAAIAGQGLVYGPRFLTVQALLDGSLVELALDVPVRDAGAIYAVTHATRRPAAKTRVWIDYLASRMRQLAANW